RPLAAHLRVRRPRPHPTCHGHYLTEALGSSRTPKSRRSRLFGVGAWGVFLPAGGLGVSPNTSPPPQRGAGASLPGVWGCPPIIPLSHKGGAGVSLPGV